MKRENFPENYDGVVMENRFIILVLLRYTKFEYTTECEHTVVLASIPKYHPLIIEKFLYAFLKLILFT